MARRIAVYGKQKHRIVTTKCDLWEDLNDKTGSSSIVTKTPLKLNKGANSNFKVDKHGICYGHEKNTNSQYTYYNSTPDIEQNKNDDSTLHNSHGEYCRKCKQKVCSPDQDIYHILSPLLTPVKTSHCHLCKELSGLNIGNTSRTSLNSKAQESVGNTFRQSNSESQELIDYRSCSCSSEIGSEISCPDSEGNNLCQVHTLLVSDESSGLNASQHHNGSSLLSPGCDLDNCFDSKCGSRKENVICGGHYKLHSPLHPVSQNTKKKSETSNQPAYTFGDPASFHQAVSERTQNSHQNSLTPELKNCVCTATSSKRTGTININCTTCAVLLSPLNGNFLTDIQSPIVNISFKDAVTPHKYIPAQSSLKLLTTKEKVLSLCNQTSVVKFDDFFQKRKICSIEKIGEGSFGEVFKCFFDEIIVTLKVVPVAGDLMVNGDDHQTFEELLTEIAIAKELSALGTDKENKANATSSFLQLNSVTCCMGRYPGKLLKAWRLWDKANYSENDSPAIFDEDQHYIIFESNYGGRDLEHSEISSVAVCRSIIHQITAALAIAESELEFEHRDLHWGNVLLTPTSEPRICMKLDGQQVAIESKGILVTIIDFTLSRLVRDGCVVCNDLEKDGSLFGGEGDYQFDVYRQMREELNKEWVHYCPKTNAMWIKYIVDKLLKVKLRKNSSKNLAAFLRRLGTYFSAMHVLTDKYFQ